MSLGQIRNNHGAAGDTASLHFVVSSFNNSAALARISGSRDTDGGVDLLFSTSNSGQAPTEKLRISEGGNIGTATTTPWAKLSVAGASNGTIPLFTISSSTASATSTAFMVGQNGNVGIGTTTPTTALQVAGVVTPNQDNTSTLGNSTYRWSAVYAVNNVIQTSDVRMKDNITSTMYGLDQLLQLRPVSYVWKAHPEQGTYLGFIAQEASPSFRRR